MFALLFLRHQYENRIIIHLDLDYFFAQVEERRRPGIADKPVVVCVYTNEEKTKGVVSTANYIARKSGVHSAMPVSQAKSLLKGKDAVFLPVDHETYEKISLEIAETLAEYADAFEQSSIDEFYLDVSGRTKGSYSAAEKLAREIKNKLVEKFGLTCSVGIAPNKLVAKIAAGLKKPDGLAVVVPEAVEDFLGPLEVDKIPGVGAKTKEFLNSRGIRTVKELREADFAALAEEIGKSAAGTLFQYSRGIDDSPVMPATAQKQLSRIATLKEPAQFHEEIEGIVASLASEIAQKLVEYKLSCKAVGINAVDSAMAAHSKSRTLLSPTQDAKTIEKTALELYRELFSEKRLLIRRVGVRVEQLDNTEGQKKLFDF